MATDDKNINVDDIAGTEVPQIALHGANRHRRRSSRNKFLKTLVKAYKRYFRWRVLLIGTVVFLTVSTLMLSVLITDAIARLNTASASLNRVMNGISATSGTELTLSDFSRLQSSLNELSNQIRNSRSRLALLGSLPNLNAEWRVSGDALDVSQDLTDAALAMLSGVEPALDFMVQGDMGESVTTGISSGQRVVEQLHLGLGRFVQAQKALRVAEAKLNAIDLTDVSSEMLLQVEQLRAYHAQLNEVNTTLLIAPNILTTLLGLDEQRTYLVLAQNNDEIRPSGGYISTYGWFSVNGARIIDFDYSPTTTNNPNPPDAEFLETFEIPSWWIRFGEPIYAAWDGSWYADFRSTAELAMNYYNAGGNPQAPVDGVLAIDVTGFELLLGAIGKVTVSDYGVVVDTNNFRNIVYDIRAFGEGVTPHKEFVAAVYRSIFAEWRTLDSSRTSALLGALLEGVQRRHIMIYFADDNINQVITTLGWNGAQEAGIGHDYILVADANLGNKSNNSVIRSMTYDIQISADGSARSRLGLRYDYFDAVASNDPAVDAEYHGGLDYNNLIQIFLPLNVTLNDATDLTPTVIPLPEHTLLVGLTTVVYDTSERFTFDYQPPDVVDTLGNYQQYRLLIQKQAGARPQQANIQITLPANAQFINSNPAPDANYELENPILDYRLNLDRDIWIEVIYQTD